MRRPLQVGVQPSTLHRSNDDATSAEIRSDHRLERRFLFRGVVALAAAGVVILLRHVLGS
jgi:hypothetical protein